MTDTDGATEDEVDFVVAAYRVDGEWELARLPTATVGDLDRIVRALSQLPSEVGVLGLVSVDDDYFVLLRVAGTAVRLLVSDAEAAPDSALATAILDRLGTERPAGDDDAPEPAGDLGIVADLGIRAAELAELCDSDDLYPDEVLGDIATRLGFGRLFEDIVESVGE